MVDEVVLSWNIRALSVTSTTRFLFKKSVVSHQQLLNNVSGYAKSGNLLAIMGPSGAGKTTLLATISQRNKAPKLDGEVLLNGRAVDRDLMVRISGFMPQQDLSVTCLSALEHLNFMASLTLDRRVSEIQKERIISGLLNDLHLMTCEHTKISKLSVGERKRLSLATQMITDPPILFCDEPTTGLDSYSASSVVTVLQTLTTRGKLVICSIHKPASDVYIMFDNLCLLAPGGHLVYYGSNEGAETHFKSLGLECPTLYNPADFYITKLNSIENEMEDICLQFINSSAGITLASNIEELKKASIMNQFVYGIEEKFLKFYALPVVLRLDCKKEARSIHLHSIHEN